MNKLMLWIPIYGAFYFDYLVHYSQDFAKDHFYNRKFNVWDMLHTIYHSICFVCLVISMIYMAVLCL